MRGEYIYTTASVIVFTELPPRARRIPDQVILDFNIFGTTSACAENTHQRLGIFPASGNYLRVRGEYALGAMPGSMG